MEFDILRMVSILRDLDDHDLAAFGELLEVRQVKRGARLIEEGTPVSEFSIICNGVVHVRRLAQKRQMLMGRLGVGRFFGEINLFDPGVATASIIAMEPTQLAVISYEKFRAFMAERPKAGYKITSAMMTEMCHRLRQVSWRLVTAVYWGGEEEAAAASTRGS